MQDNITQVDIIPRPANRIDLIAGFAEVGSNQFITTFQNTLSDPHLNTLSDSPVRRWTKKGHLISKSDALIIS